MTGVAPRAHQILRARRGYTLAELLVVLFLLAVVGALAVPRFANAQASYRAEGAARQVAEAIRHVSNQARLRGVSIRLYFDIKARTINAAVISTSEVVYAESLSAPPFSAAIDWACFADGGQHVCISPHGTFCTSMVVAVSAGSRSAAVTLDGPAGEVKVTTVAEAKAFESSARFR